MKISDSSLFFASDNLFEQQNLLVNEKTREQVLASHDNARHTDPESDGLFVYIDRVSISRNKKLEYQSGYCADMHSHSIVKSVENDDIAEHDNKSAVEKLVGSVIDNDVVLKNIRQKKEQASDTMVKDFSSDQGSAAADQRADSGNGGSMMTQISVNSTRIHFEQEKMEFESSGKVTTDDGRVIDFSMGMSLDRKFLSREHENIMIRKWQDKIDLTDPLVINLEGRTPGLSDMTFEFDLNSDGIKENINFAASGTGFLALDKNNDNVINNGSELFGPATGNGFEELAAFDDDHNMWIDENDAVFSKLSVWTKDAEGRDRIISLKEAGIGAIALEHSATGFDITRTDNRLEGRLKTTGVFLFENGNVGSVHQIDLAAHDSDPSNDSVTPDVSEQVEPEHNPGPDHDLFSGIMTSLPQTGPVNYDMSGSGTVEPASNPLMELLKRIKELKEQMEKMYKTMYEESGHKSMFRRDSLNYDNSCLTRPGRLSAGSAAAGMFLSVRR